MEGSKLIRVNSEWTDEQVENLTASLEENFDASFVVVRDENMDVIHSED